MESSRSPHSNRATADGLLVIVDSTGVPGLVRMYGDVQRPPSAAIGITSAVFHAATTGDKTALQILQSQHRSIVYVQQAHDLLLIFAQAHTEDQTLLVESAAERMLRLVFHALQLTIGPSFTEMESSKLRGAVARQVSIIDYICTRITVDPSLVMGVPTFAIGSTRSSLSSDVHPPSLLYAAHLRNGIVDSELCASSSNPPVGRDLLILCVLAQVSQSQQTTQTTIHIHGGEKTTMLKAIAAFGRSAQDGCVLGIFSPNTSELILESATFRSNASLARWPYKRVPLLEELGLLCFFATGNDQRQDSSVPQRGIFCSNFRAFPTSCDDQGAWQTLGRFVLHCSSKTPSMTRRMDYMQQDEVRTNYLCNGKLA